MKRNRVQISFADAPSRVQQNYKDDCTPAAIVRKYRRTGEIKFANYDFQYGDATAANDLLTAVQVVKDAKEAFGELPSKVRERFSNDPSKLLDFISHPENFDEAVSLGIISENAQKRSQSDVITPSATSVAGTTVASPRVAPEGVSAISGVPDDAA